MGVFRQPGSGSGSGRMGPVRAGLQPGLQTAARCWTRTEWFVRRAAEEETEPENTYWTLETHRGGHSGEHHVYRNGNIRKQTNKQKNGFLAKARWLAY